MDLEKWKNWSTKCSINKNFTSFIGGSQTRSFPKVVLGYQVYFPLVCEMHNWDTSIGKLDNGDTVNHYHAL